MVRVKKRVRAKKHEGNKKTASLSLPRSKTLRVECGHVALHSASGAGDFALHGCGFSMYSKLGDGGSLVGALPGPYEVGSSIDIDGILAGSSLGRGRAWVGSGQWNPQWYSGSLEFDSRRVRITRRTPRRARFCLRTTFRMRGNLVGETSNPLISSDPPVWSYGVRGRGHVILDMTSAPDPAHGRLWELQRLVLCFHPSPKHR